MKKFLFCVVLLAAVLMPLAASAAEYVTFYDILKDAKTFAGKDIDSQWEKTSEDALAVINNKFYGYKCGEKEDNVITCTQKHWTGDYQIKMYFSEEDKLELIDYVLTGDSLRTLNYKKGGTSTVHQADDFYKRMEEAGYFSYAYANNGFDMIPNILPNEDTVPYTPAIQADDHSFVQFAYNVISDDNPEFTLEFLFASEEYARAHGRSDFEQ